MQMGEQAWSMDRMMQLATGYWGSAVLGAGVELGVFETLGSAGAKGGGTGGMSAQEVADSLSLDPRSTGMLLDALCGLGLLQLEEGSYRLEASAAEFLSPAGSMCLLDALRLNLGMYQYWGRLSEAVRTGKPVVDPSAHLGSDAGRTEVFVRGMYSRALGLARLVVPSIQPEMRGRVLDVGSGPGVFSAEPAANDPSLSVVQFDLPGVVAVAERLLAEHPAKERIEFQPGDYRNDALPSGFDTVLYCGALHQESNQTAAALFAKIAESLHPGGRLFVVDMMLEDSGTSPAFSTLFALNMMLINPFARMFKASEACGLLEGAGLKVEAYRQLATSPYWMIRAIRPTAT